MIRHLGKHVMTPALAGWARAVANHPAIWLIALLAVIGGAAPPAFAQEQLLNRSFETPVAPNAGNNFYATIPSWTLSGSAQANIVRPNALYAGGPTAPPTGGGAQYLDVVNASATVSQTVTLAVAGVVDFSAWFSVRDTAQILGGVAVNIRNAGGTVVATASTSFVLTDALGVWKQAAATNVALPAGTYTFEIVLPDAANTDLASFVIKAPLTMTKSGTTYSDPVNGTTNPKLIPGGIAEYTLTVANTATYTVAANSIAITDATPTGTDLVLTDIGTTGSGPARFTAGASALTYTFTSLASTTDDIDFSNNGGSTWTYVPAVNANGVDTTVTNVRLRPRGSMAASSTFAFGLRYRVR